ncbi:MAG: putative sulfate exporter family transporter [Halomonas sp.]|nr:putative sulfate exporter family transporter [Halomonas sp.]
MRQGLAVCTALTVVGFGLAQLPLLAGAGISPLVVALLLGILVGNTPLAGRLQHTAPGLKFATRWLLRSGIVLFGLSLTLQQVAALGPRVLLLDVLVITSVLVAGYLIGTRVLGMDRETRNRRVEPITEQEETRLGHRADRRDDRSALLLTSGIAARDAHQSGDQQSAQ